MLAYLFLSCYNMQIYLSTLLKNANLPFHAHLPFSFKLKHSNLPFNFIKTYKLTF